MVRVVNQQQAAVVRRVFEMYSSKMGLTTIAKALNADGIPAPRTNSGWAPSAIREMLYRPLYRGQIVRNEYQKIEMHLIIVLFQMIYGTERMIV